MSDYEMLVIGGCGVDTIVRVDELELPGGDMLAVPPIHDYVAHTGNGVALGFHALGRTTKFIDFLGDDNIGQTILARYATVGLDFSHLPAPNGTPRSVNLVDSQGRRFSFYDGRHPADLLMPWEFCAPYVARADHVYLSRSHFNRDLFDRIRERAIPTVTDLHAWDGKETDAHPWAYGADIVFMSAATVGGEVQDVLRNIISNGRAELAVATDGANGCFVLERGSTTVRHFAAVQPDRPVVDSNGAGDAFLTAFLHTRFDGGTIEACVLAGSISGAFACSHHGTHEVQITAQQLEERAHRLQAPTL